MIWQLALIGLLVALFPLIWVWSGGRQDRYRALVLVTLFLTFDLIVFGGFTRLTDSGLGCPDWPGCYGTANPYHAREQIRAAEAAMPSGPVTWSKAWIEMIHRYLAMAVGVLIVVLTWLAWLNRNELKPLRWFASGLLVLVCIQGAFGAWSVVYRLQPLIVTLHLLLGLTLLASLALFEARSSMSLQQSGASLSATLRRASTLGLLLLIVQIALGGWVSSNYAVLACTDFPSCNGRLIPPMNFADGFTLWRPLGMTDSGEWLPYEALVAIHWTHRAFAGLVAGYMLWVGYRVRRIGALRQSGNWLMMLTVLQILTGLSNVVLQWPLPAALAHNAGAAGLLLILVRLRYALRSSTKLAAVSSPQPPRVPL